MDSYSTLPCGLEKPVRMMGKPFLETKAIFLKIVSSG